MPPAPTVALPATLEAQFVALKQRLRRVETLKAAAQIAAALLFSFLALFISDRFWDTPLWARWALAATGWIVAISIAANYVRRWVLKSRSTEELAVYVQSRYQRLGDRLLGIVELAHEHRRPANFSPELYQAAIEQVTQEANTYNFTEAVPTKWLRRWTTITVAALVLIVIFGVIVPGAVAVSGQRWAMPFANIPRHTLVVITKAPSEKIVAHGEPFEIDVAVKYRSFWKPKKLTASLDGQPPIVVTLKDGAGAIRFPGQTQRDEALIEVGDASARVAVLPSHRSALKSLDAEIALPRYLEYPPTTQPAHSGALVALEGSKVTFAGAITRPITSASMQTSSVPVTSSLPVNGSAFKTAPLAVDGLTEVAFHWQDQFGLQPLSPWKLLVQTTKDAAPTPELVDLPRDLAILHSENLELKTLARDDYGVQSVGLLWIPPSDGSDTNAPDAQEIRIDAEGSDRRELQETFSFSPALMRVPPDTVVDIAAFATDFYPGRDRSESTVYRVHVLGNEQHAEMIRQRLESLAVQMEEISRMQEKVNLETAQLQNDPKLSTPEGEKKLEDLEAQQNQNAQSLDQAAEEGADALREALRNPAFPEETVRDWSKNVKGMKEVAKGEMKQASQKLSEAKSSPQTRSQNLAEAEEKEAEALDKLQQLQKKMQKSMDDLQALTLAQRLHKLGGEESDISKGLQKNIAETVGLLPVELAPRFQRVNTTLAGEQGAAQAAAKELQDEISRFYERTQRENYGNVFKAMTEKRSVEELDRLRSLIGENIAMEAMQDLNRWSTQFVAWAKLLEPPEAKGEGGDGGGSGEDSAADKVTKHLVELLRLREGQINVREKTRLVEKERAEEATHKEAAKLLTDAQSVLIQRLEETRQESPIALLEPALREADEHMQKAHGLLSEAKTGKEATDIETSAVEALTDAINIINENAQRAKGNQQQGEQSEATAAEMAFLTQMMAQPQKGMPTGQMPGGNMSGGTTDRPATSTPGNDDGTADQSRSVNRASGVSTSTPIEFRDALQQYFQALESETP